MSGRPDQEDGRATTARAGRREFLAALAVVLAGALLVLLASAMPWAAVADPTLTVPPSVREELSGEAVAPAARALGLVGLAGLVALAATRRLGRRVVGMVLVLAGVGAAAASLFWSAETTWGTGDTPTPLRETWWPWVSACGGLLLLAVGLAAVIRSGHWPTMGDRYAPPGARSRRADDPWSALDRGEDPTD